MEGDNNSPTSFNFFAKKGICKNFTCRYTPQQNGVIERKNIILVDIARTMLCKIGIPKYFWTEAINTTYHILNRVSISPILKRTPYELYYERKPIISYFMFFVTHILYPIIEKII